MAVRLAGVPAITGTAPRQVPRCRRAVIQAATDRVHRVRNWICINPSCAVHPTAAGTAAIAAHQITADLGLAMAEAAVDRATVEAAAHRATVGVAIRRAMAEAAVGTIAAVVDTPAEEAEATPVAAVTAVVVIGNSIL